MSLQNTSRNVSKNTLNIEQQQTVVNYNKISCPNCDKKLCNEYALKRHRDTVCGKVRNPNGKFKCDKCTRTYKSNGSLTRHKNVHNSKPREHTCNLCGHKFTEKSSLVRHIEKMTCKEIRQILDDEKKRKKT